MRRAPGLRAGVYTSRADGDQRDEAAWLAVARRLGLSGPRATVRQVHGARVIEVDGEGPRGDADGMHTTLPQLPLAVFVADCLAVLVEADDRVGVAHAGWRGLAAGVVRNLVDDMREAGSEPVRAAIGPSIRACCFEVGSEVAERFDPAFAATTTWGSMSLDLSAIARDQMAGIEVWETGTCTRCGGESFSHRLDRTRHRMAGVVWLEGTS